MFLVWEPCYEDHCFERMVLSARSSQVERYSSHSGTGAGGGPQGLLLETGGEVLLSIKNSKLCSQDPYLAHSCFSTSPFKLSQVWWKSLLVGSGKLLEISKSFMVKSIF